MSECQIEMPRYQSHKQVWALKIKSISEGAQNDEFAVLAFDDERYAPITVSADWHYSHKPEVGGYYVVYKDGYASFSPADAFESGYVLSGKPIPDIQQLMTFYGCDTAADLIREQDRHVRQLQERLRPYLKEPHQINRVREG